MNDQPTKCDVDAAWAVRARMIALFCDHASRAPNQRNAQALRNLAQSWEQINVLHHITYDGESVDDFGGITSQRMGFIHARGSTLGEGFFVSKLTKCDLDVVETVRSARLPVWVNRASGAEPGYSGNPSFYRDCYANLSAEELVDTLGWVMDRVREARGEEPTL